MALDLRVEGGGRRWHGGLGLTNEPGDHRVTDDKWLSPATPGSSFHHELLCFPNANINTSTNTDTNIKTNTNTNTIPTSLPIPTATSRPTAALLPTTPLFHSCSAFLQFLPLSPYGYASRTNSLVAATFAQPNPARVYSIMCHCSQRLCLLYIFFFVSYS